MKYRNKLSQEESLLSCGNATMITVRSENKFLRNEFLDSATVK
jgi:hypothetical protein